MSVLGHVYVNIRSRWGLFDVGHDDALYDRLNIISRNGIQNSKSIIL